MKSLALIGCITIIILGSIQAQFHEQQITFPIQMITLEKDSITLPKAALTKEDIDTFLISKIEKMAYHHASYPTFPENNAATSMEWALVKSDIPNK
ncbi:MAG: hypothetical protein ACI94Y_001583 [Maribacter sp.]|jgi:hypothetical protein